MTPPFRELFPSVITAALLLFVYGEALSAELVREERIYRSPLFLTEVRDLQFGDGDKRVLFHEKQHSSDTGRHAVISALDPAGTRDLTFNLSRPIALSQDGNRLLSYACCSGVIAHDLPAGTPAFPSNFFYVNRIWPLRRGASVFGYGGEFPNQEVRLLDLASGTTTLAYTLKIPSGSSSRESPYHLPPSGRYVFTVREDNSGRYTVCRIELLSGTERCRPLIDPTYFPTFLPSQSVVSADGRTALIVSYPPAMPGAKASDAAASKAPVISQPPLSILDFSRNTTAEFVMDSPYGQPFVSSGGGFYGVPKCRSGSLSTTLVRSSTGLSSEFIDKNAINAFSAHPANSCADYRPAVISNNGELLTVVTYTRETVSNSDGRCTNCPVPHVSIFKNPLYQPLPANLAQYEGGIPASSSNVKSSADGKLAVFQSEIPAEQLLCFDADSQVFSPGCAPADTNARADIFRYDRDRNSVELVSSSDGMTAFGGQNPAIDLRGEAIVFEALDSGIPAQDLRDGKHYGTRTHKASITSVFLLNLTRGTSQRTARRMSVGRSGAAPDGNSVNPSISGNGQYVVFATEASNVNPEADSNNVRDVVAVETSSGTVRCVSSCPGAVANAPSDFPSVSNTGQVALETRADSLVKEYRGKGSSPFSQIAVFDLQRRTSRTVSRETSGQPGSGDSGRAHISSSGNAVVYQSAAPNLTPGDANGRTDIFLANLLSNTNQRISRKPPPGGKANAYAPKATAGVEDGDSLRPTISGDGRFVAFQTTATNLVDTDANGVTDLVVADARSGELRRIYQGFGGVETDGASETPHLNNNGTHLGFHSFATNLNEAGDTDTSTSEPYVRDNPQTADVVFFDPFE